MKLGTIETTDGGLIERSRRGDTMFSWDGTALVATPATVVDPIPADGVVVRYLVGEDALDLVDGDELDAIEFERERSAVDGDRAGVGEEGGEGGEKGSLFGGSDAVVRGEVIGEREERRELGEADGDFEADFEASEPMFTR